MIMILMRAGAFFLKNPLMIAVGILTIATAFFFVQAKYHKSAAEKAVVRALGAETALQRTKARESRLKALQQTHRQENEVIQKNIAGRTYFDTAGGL